MLNPINIAQSIRSVLISNTVHYVEEASIIYQTGKVRRFIKNPKSFPGLWHLNPPPHALVTLGSAAEDNESLPLSSMATLNSLDTTQPTLKESGPMLLLYLHCTTATGASACITTSAQKTPGWRSSARLLANTTDLTFVASTNFLTPSSATPPTCSQCCGGSSRPSTHRWTCSCRGISTLHSHRESWRLWTSGWKAGRLCTWWGTILSTVIPCLAGSGERGWGGAGPLGNPSGRRSWPILSVEVAGQAMVRTKHFWKDMFGRNLPEEWSSMTATSARSGLRAHSAFPLKDWTGLTISSEHIEAINLFG